MAPSTATSARAPWLLSPALDLAGILGSVAVSWILYACWRAGWIATQELVLIWIFLLHGPHFFATYARTVLDRAERRRRRTMYRRSLLWFVVGPVMVGAAVLLSIPDLALLFFFGAALWAYHHVAKQHFGFVALYRARNGVFDRADMKFTRYYLLVSLWIPVLILMSGSALWLQQVPGFELLLRSVAAERAEAFLARSRSVLTALFWSLQAVFVLSRLWRLKTGRRVAAPELAVVAAAVSLSWFVAQGVLSVVSDPVLSQQDPIAAYALVPIVTSYHNIQYHVLVWFHNRRKYAAAARADHGWAVPLSRSAFLYLGCGLAFTAATIGVEYYGLAIFRHETFGRILAAFVWGFSFVHYWIDGHVWKVSEDRELQAVLGFERPAARAPAAALAREGAAIAQISMAESRSAASSTKPS